MVTTDFRRVLGEAVYKALGRRKMDVVFPGASVEPGGFWGYVGVVLRMQNGWIWFYFGV